MSVQREFKDRLLAGEHLMGTFISTASARAAEACAMGGLDWALVDLEHGLGAEHGLVTQAQALQAYGTAVVARIESTERIRIGQALDAGADAVMLPRVANAAEAEAATRHLWYPPRGDRGVAGYTRARAYGRDPRTQEQVDEGLAGIVQIESEDALREVYTIAALTGVDALFVGPSDLTSALGIPGQLEHVEFGRAVRRVADACRSAGIAAGILSFGVETVAHYADLGYTLHAVGSDAATLANTSAGIVAARPRQAR